MLKLCSFDVIASSLILGTSMAKLESLDIIALMPVVAPPSFGGGVSSWWAALANILKRE